MITSFVDQNLLFDNIRKSCSSIKACLIKVLALQVDSGFTELFEPIFNIINNALGDDCDIFSIADPQQNDCCPDIISARHVEAGGILFIGDLCTTFHSNDLKVFHCPIPFKCEFSFVQDFAKFFISNSNALKKSLIVILESNYRHIEVPLLILLKDCKVSCFSSTDLTHAALMSGMNYHEDAQVAYVGRDVQSGLFHRMCLYFATQRIIHAEPMSSKIEFLGPFNKLLSKRLHLIEKCKNISTFGILMSPLLSNNLISEAAQNFAVSNHKSVHMFSIGKFSIQKLGNFPEVKAFLYLGCPNAAFDEKRFKDYSHLTILSPYEFYWAIKGTLEHWDGTFKDDCNLFNEKNFNTDVVSFGNCLDVAITNFTDKTFQGISKSVIGDRINETKGILAGRSGIASEYLDESGK